MSEEGPSCSGIHAASPHLAEDMHQVCLASLLVLWVLLCLQLWGNARVWLQSEKLLS